MLLPTYATAYGADGGGGGTVRHGWWDPFLLVYLDVIPMTALACGIAALLGTLWGVLHGRVAGWVTVPSALGALLDVLFSYDANDLGFVTGAGLLVAPALAVSSLLTAASWWQGRQTPRLRPGGRGSPLR